MSQIDELFSRSLEITENYKTLVSKLKYGVTQSKNMTADDKNSLFEHANVAYNKLGNNISEIEKNKGSAYDAAKTLYSTRNPSSWGKESEFNNLLKNMHQYKQELEYCIKGINCEPKKIISDLETFVQNF